MTIQIIEKLRAEINRGLTTEAQVVYLLAGVRKIIEQENLSSQYAYLEFHCNWVLHSMLRGTFAQKILKEFDSVHTGLLEGKELPANGEVSKISGMEYLKEELIRFLGQHGITGMFRDPNDWTQFLYLYTRVIEDVPLRIRADNPARVNEIVVSISFNDEILRPHRFFKVTWRVMDCDGKAGDIFSIHSYENLKAARVGVR